MVELLLHCNTTWLNISKPVGQMGPAGGPLCLTLASSHSSTPQTTPLTRHYSSPRPQKDPISQPSFDDLVIGKT